MKVFVAAGYSMMAFVAACYTMKAKAFVVAGIV
jgi:hypothetical protein